MSNYYFLGTLLPALQIGVEPEITLEYFLTVIKGHLSALDYKKTEAIRTYFDIENIRSFWTGMELDRWGNFDENRLEEALLTGSGLPLYVYDFVEKYDTKEKRLKHFSALHASFFQEQASIQSGFLQTLFNEERKIRLILTALRAKEQRRDFLVEFQYEDPNDPLIAEILSQKDSKDYTPPSGFEDLKILYESHKDDPLNLYKAFLEYRFRKIEALVGLQTFTIDRILAYMFQLILVEKWSSLDRKKGQQMINTILQGSI